MANVKISILSEFLGKGLKDAEKSIKGFEKSVKRVGFLFGGGYLGAKILGFSKVAVKAFAADDNAARSLGLTIKNLGLGYDGAAKSVNDYISNLERQTGVLDDELRPAMDRLLRATGSITKSQELLGLSLDIAAGTGKSLTQVSQSLQKAYLGQTQALGRLGVGLSKAELTSSNFEEIQKRLTILFKGQAVSAANSYQGSIDKITVAMNNAKEVIGKGMVEALTGSGGTGGLSGALDVVAKSAQIVSDLFVGIGRTKGYLGELFTTKPGVSPLQAFRNAQALAAEYRKIDKFGGVKPTGIIPSISSMVSASQAAKAEKNALNTAKALTNEKKKQLALDKAKAALAKAQANFDITKINLAAALKGKVSEEDRKRLLALQAIENNNGEEALKWIAQLDYQKKLAAEAEEERLRKLHDAEMARQQVLLDMIAKIQRKKLYNIEEEQLAKLAAEQAAAAALASILAASAASSSGVAGYSAMGSGAYDIPVNPYAGTYYGETGRDPMPVSLNISLDGQAFQSAVVGAVNNASASGTGLAYTQTAVRY